MNQSRKNSQYLLFNHSHDSNKIFSIVKIKNKKKNSKKVILKILGQVSSGEKLKNKALEKKTAQVLKTLAYLKATTENKKLGA